MPRKKKTEVVPVSATEFWRGSFGDQYLIRNRVKWQDRTPFLRRMVEMTGARTFLDVGCNAGWNLLALRSILGDQLMASGLDLNRAALQECAQNGFDVEEGHAADIGVKHWAGCSANLVITSGVLIHIPPKELAATMRAIANFSDAYVLAIEYFAEKEEAVEYRGHLAKLWRRPFAKLYEEFGLSVVETGEAEGFDRCQYALLERA